MAAVAGRWRVSGSVGSGLAVWLLAVAAATGFDGSECERILRESIERRAFPGCTAVVGTEQTVLWSAAIGHHGSTLD